MLYTLTMHPAVDLFFNPALRADAAVRAGGKGVNVSRFLRALGRPSRCVVLCGGARGRFLCASLAEEGLDVLPVDDPAGLCRINLKCTGAQELALDRLLLEVRVSNAPAIALYEKLGFSPLGVRPGFYEAPREDALIMQRVF